MSIYDVDLRCWYSLPDEATDSSSRKDPARLLFWQADHTSRAEKIIIGIFLFEATTDLVVTYQLPPERHTRPLLRWRRLIEHTPPRSRWSQRWLSWQSELTGTSGSPWYKLEPRPSVNLDFQPSMTPTITCRFSAMMGPCNTKHQIILDKPEDWDG